MNGLVLGAPEIAVLRPRVDPEPQPTFPPAPSSLDYRTLGFVSNVVDQGNKFVEVPMKVQRTFFQDFTVQVATRFRLKQQSKELFSRSTGGL